MFHTDKGKTDRHDMTKLIVTFRNFANMTKNDSSLLEVLIPQGLHLCSNAMQDGCTVSY